MNVEKYGFKLLDVEISQFHIERCYRYEGQDFVVAQISQSDGDQWTKHYLGDDVVCDVQELLSLFSCHFLLLAWKAQDEDRLLFLSDVSKVRALEFLDYMIAEFGLVRGNAGCASGQISSAILSVQISDMDLEDTMEYLLRMASSYYEECDWIEASSYGVEHEAEIKQMKQYVKQRIAWAYVKSTDVVPSGEQLRIKSLENESGMLLTSGEDTYIMIGCRGEVYDISREKFERTYDATEEELDVFEQMLDFLPAIETVSDGDYISVDDVAHLCYPKRGTGIYGVELQRRTKVFPSNNQEYFLGRPGDYMAVRLDDCTDIYIIQREIFLQTYEEKI